MAKTESYNPLDKFNIAKSIESEVLARPAAPLAEVGGITGAGVYVIYYTGDFAAYAPVANANQNGELTQPIYVGKAIPRGGRKGGLATDIAAKGNALADRLRQHAASIDEAQNLNLEHFFVRHLVVDDIWIPLGENMLIETFKPIWNRAIDGFGNKDPGRRRSTQYRSPWDVLHPGRKFAEKLAESPATPDLLLQRIGDYFADRPLTKLPRAVVEQQEEEEVDAEDAADDL
ncbi:Eco29kI family restriction endonuclease [Amorphus orientalis]|uniref:Eco29kI restriction endonuclease n=1 Tax=Amorphus orientalis TaxID=649198 RepID=A0AAE3VQD0_9HYPH|nr:Eco29kI family restriction endonuclease [Amorphus orientalis]MDQ0316384.1 hypothetical protein [Amorphus orientalis]